MDYPTQERHKIKCATNKIHSISYFGFREESVEFHPAGVVLPSHSPATAAHRHVRDGSRVVGTVWTVSAHHLAQPSRVWPVLHGYN